MNQRFTEVLTSIDEKSENTERQINTMVFRIVDAFLAVRSEGLPTTATVVEQLEGDETRREQPDRELRLELSRMSQAIDEIRLRQRVQPTISELDLPTSLDASSYKIGDKVRILESHPRVDFHGQIGTVEFFRRNHVLVNLETYPGNRWFLGGHVEPADTLPA